MDIDRMDDNLAGLDDLDALGAFGSLARGFAGEKPASLAAQAELDPEQALDVLAGALARQLGSESKARALQALAAMSQAAWEAARQSAPEWADGFTPCEMILNLRPDPFRPGWVWGQVETGSQANGSNYLEEFHCSEENCAAQALRAGAQNLLRLHPDFQYVENFDYLPDDEQRRLDAFLTALRGGEALAVAEALEDLGRFGERDDLALWLCERAAQAARAGLLPQAFERSGMRLWHGMRGEPLLISRWELLKEGEFFSSMGFASSQHVDALGALDGAWGFEPSSTWTLPPLDAGREAAWSALCEHLARAAAFDWQKLPAYVVGDFAERVNCALQARELRHETAPAEPGVRRPRL